jgi:hypothetical protein
MKGAEHAEAICMLDELVPIGSALLSVQTQTIRGG